MIIRCTRGVFTLPPDIYEALRAASPAGLVYVRQDEDVLTISSTRIVDARRRHLSPSYRIAMFHDAIKLAVVDMKEHVQFMAVEWRKRASERRRDAPSFD